MAAVTFGENGQVVDELNRTETIRARDDALRLILSGGLVYMMKVPIKKPGSYQLVVRAGATKTTLDAATVTRFRVRR